MLGGSLAAIPVLLGPLLAADAAASVENSKVEELRQNGFKPDPTEAAGGVHAKGVAEGSTAQGEAEPQEKKRGRTKV